MTPSTTTTPSVRTALTRTATSPTSRPVGGVGLGDAEQVGRRLREVGHLHPLGDPAPVLRASSPRRAAPSRPRARCTPRWRAGCRCGSARRGACGWSARRGAGARRAPGAARCGSRAPCSRRAARRRACRAAWRTSTGRGRRCRAPADVTAWVGAGRVSVWRCRHPPLPGQPGFVVPAPEDRPRLRPARRARARRSTRPTGCCSSRTPTSGSTRWRTGG